jgi:hypothetical protein
MPFRAAASRSLRTTLLVGVVAGLMLTDARALTVFDLLTEPELTPKKFASKFERFEYEFDALVQPPEVFLRREIGDCDDYAILADHILKQRGFQTRIIHIRLVGRVAHAVCYVDGAKAYLDYNNRRYFRNVERCGRRLREIADEVASSFKGNWTSVSEFTYDYKEGKKHFARTVVKTDPPESDADAGVR